MTDTTDTTFTALCAAIDDCPEDELPDRLAVLADWLEDVQDERAEGLRLVGDRQPICRPALDQELPEWKWAWRIAPSRNPDDSDYTLPLEVFTRLQGGIRGAYSRTSLARGIWMRYPTRHNAFLALAAALTETQS